MIDEMKWFVAEAIFQSTREFHRPDWQPVEERLLYLVRTNSMQAAVEKAAAIATAKEHSYDNVKGERVIWNFTELVEVTELIDQDFQDGAEIKSWLTGGERRK